MTRTCRTSSTKAHLEEYLDVADLRAYLIAMALSSIIIDEVCRALHSSSDRRGNRGHRRGGCEGPPECHLDELIQEEVCLGSSGVTPVAVAGVPYMVDRYWRIMSISLLHPIRVAALLQTDHMHVRNSVGLWVGVA